MVILDSSVWIESLRREGDLVTTLAVEALLEEYEATLCSPVRMEVLGGARKQDREALDDYFSVIPYLRVKEGDWTAACRNAWKLSEVGVRVPWSDLLIATVSMRVGCRVYAADKHFDLMSKHLPMRLYRPGYGGKFEAE